MTDPTPLTAPAARWRIRHTDAGARLGQLRAFGTDAFTWADLLRASLATVKVHAIYFPSRFALPVDTDATESLRVFGSMSSNLTSVDFWDPTDPHFSEALELFGLSRPPALVLAAGLEGSDVAAGPTAGGGVPEGLYCIAFSDTDVLSDRVRLASAVNIAHEILTRCDSREIAQYIRGRKMRALLEAIGHGAGTVREHLLTLHPTFGLPGGFSLELG